MVMVMTEISDNNVWYVCGWLRSFIRDTEGSGRELSIAYIENLNVEGVNGMVLPDVQRIHPDHGYVLQHVRDWPLTEQLRRVVGSLSRRNGNQKTEHVRNLMIAEIERTRPRTGPPGPKEFDIVYPPPGASESMMRVSTLLSRLSFLLNETI
jgi:hypothetical protein